ncbi:MAG: ABC transporter ATP-binding protein, partial [Halofilum sp. (in: g-proteobacteria)]
LIAELGREHGVILSTHILPEVQALCSRVAIMHHGRILHGGPVSAFTGRAASDRITLTLRRPPVDADIRAIDGVTDIEHLGPGRLRLRVDPDRTTPERIAETAVHADWGLVEITPDRASLEQLFVELTSGDTAAAVA